MANVKDASLYSEILKSWISLRISASGLRTVEHKGGLDAYVTGTASTKLPEELRPVRARMMKILAAAK
jgi:large subunit ribosomal protein L28